jgi:hypothetical protein
MPCSFETTVHPLDQWIWKTGVKQKLSRVTHINAAMWLAAGVGVGGGLPPPSRVQCM